MARLPMARLLAFTAAALACTHASAAADPWVLAFEDEFPGDAIDATRWNVAAAFSGDAGTISTFAARNVQVADGSLVLSASYAAAGGAWSSGRVDTSAGSCFETRENPCAASHPPIAGFAQTGSGRFEARLKLPPGSLPGIAPSFRLVQDLQPSTCFPARAEIDVVQMYGGAWRCKDCATNVVTGSVHYNATGQCGAGADVAGAAPVSFAPAKGTLAAPDWSSAFHVWAAEWNATHITFEVDGVVTGVRATATAAAALPAAITSVPFFLELGMSLCGAPECNAGVPAAALPTDPQYM